MIPGDASFIETVEQLRGLHHAPMSRATDKVLSVLDSHCRSIIAHAPFCMMATFSPEGADVSPRGDPAGFVQVLDDNHLLVPDRVGNNRLDSMVNLLTNPAIGLLFLVPGMNEALRTNGTGRITDDGRLLEGASVKGRVPKVGILVNVQEAFLHCQKALIRSDLWNADRHIDRSSLPSYPEMLMDHVKGLTDEENERQTQVMAKRGLY